MKKQLWLALLVSLGALTPNVSEANTYMNFDCITAAPDPIDTQPTAFTATPTEPGGLDGISACFVNIVLETAQKDPSAPATCTTAKTCRVGAVTQGGQCRSRDVADLKKRTVQFRDRGHRAHPRR